MLVSAQRVGRSTSTVTGADLRLSQPTSGSLAVSAAASAAFLAPFFACQARAHQHERVILALTRGTRRISVARPLSGQRTFAMAVLAFLPAVAIALLAASVAPFAIFSLAASTCRS